MDKAQALHQFWSSFGLKAYDESSVPTADKAPDFPYITYRVVTDSLENALALDGSLWYRSTSWQEIEKKADEIAHRLADKGYHIMTIDHGYVWFHKGTPFAQRMSDPEDDMIRRIYINVTAEFLTAV